jgi:hypothetical protein
MGAGVGCCGELKPVVFALLLFIHRILSLFLSSVSSSCGFYSPGSPGGGTSRRASNSCCGGVASWENSEGKRKETSERNLLLISYPYLKQF